jgi:hypothetical protein
MIALVNSQLDGAGGTEMRWMVLALGVGEMEEARVTSGGSIESVIREPTSEVVMFHLQERSGIGVLSDLMRCPFLDLWFAEVVNSVRDQPL